MRVFAQEGLGRPDLDIETESDAMQKFFKKFLPDMDPPEVNYALILTNENVEIDVESPPHPIFMLRKLKDAIRKHAKQITMSPEEIEKIMSALPEG
jgi:hypothetical protein